MYIGVFLQKAFSKTCRTSENTGLIFLVFFDNVHNNKCINIYLSDWENGMESGTLLKVSRRDFLENIPCKILTE